MEALNELVWEYEYKTELRLPPELRGKGPRKFYQRGQAYLKAIAEANWEYQWLPKLFEFANQLYDRHALLVKLGNNYEAESCWGALKVVEDVIKNRCQQLNN